MSTAYTKEGRDNLVAAKAEEVQEADEVRAYDLACGRIDGWGSEALAAYRDLFVEEDWQNRLEHLRWVANPDTTEAELLSWAQEIRRGEQEVAAQDSFRD